MRVMVSDTLTGDGLLANQNRAIPSTGKTEKQRALVKLADAEVSSLIGSGSGRVEGTLAESLQAAPGVVRYLERKSERIPAAQPSVDLDVVGAVGELVAYLAPPVQMEQGGPK
jgi:hypothetical protein